MTKTYESFINNLLFPRYPTERCDERERERGKLEKLVFYQKELRGETEPVVKIGKPLGTIIDRLR